MKEPTPEYVGSNIFGDVRTDSRVNPDTTECLYCVVYTSDSGDKQSKVANHRVEYKIPLDSISEGFRQCPACKKVYIVGKFIPES